MVPHPGPIIMDARGELVWMEDRYGQAMDFKVQQYRGHDYLTFWTGEDSGTFGTGSYVMLDSSYQLYKRISPSGDRGLMGDLHEFKITRNNTALMTIYEPKQADLSSFGVAGTGWIYDSLFQEIDIESGQLLFEWRASDHYHVQDTYHTIEAEARRPVLDLSGRRTTSRSLIGTTKDSAWDFFHINSIDKNEETGEYYISSRYMHTVTCIRPDGSIRWILGGKKNQFTDLSEGAATNFSFQHHATVHKGDENGDGNGRVLILTIFDNGKYDSQSKNAEFSRGLVVELDTQNMTARLVRQFVHPDHLLVGSQGSVQLLPPREREPEPEPDLESGGVRSGSSHHGIGDSHALVGWGYAPAYTEFDADGSVLCDVHLAPEVTFGFGWVKNYRTFRSSSWVGKPTTAPDFWVEDDDVIYVSWNGATEVDRWVLQGRVGDEDEVRVEEQDQDEEGVEDEDEDRDRDEKGKDEHEDEDEYRDTYEKHGKDADADADEYEYGDESQERKDKIKDEKLGFYFVDLSSTKKRTFETAVNIDVDTPRHIRIAAVDKNGNVLGSTEVFDRLNHDGSSAPFGLSLSVLVVVVAAVSCFSVLMWRIVAGRGGPFTTRLLPGFDAVKTRLRRLRRRHQHRSRSSTSDRYFGLKEALRLLGQNDDDDDDDDDDGDHDLSVDDEDGTGTKRDDGGGDDDDDDDDEDSWQPQKGSGGYDGSHHKEDVDVDVEAQNKSGYRR
ncbi:hypothetical protein HRR81_005974 [Exophiala dermatitidis]|nr:hypothetical protein HRR73_004900 [Exophiala dermatitidis]KAJ4570544.1 hypothetical protein HRR81_005974 [Exophiala dermatitidis]KAJ4594679.1 hypothetical protein HRR84_005953 [Exophiala dermatitidis]KAJ4624204.1 hypothetical protein HRR86_005472 [Exophiala dermatitidis]KAJ4676040.1 hypothetical protein HRR93_003939 [Exophiala dermatitidis]